MTSAPSPDELHAANAKRRRAWNKRAPSYDRSIAFFERRLFGREHRAWACDQASGDTLEIAVGTGLNLPLYKSDVTLTGIDISAEMLAIARRRAAEIAAEVDLQEGDAHALPFSDSSFDTVICTYSLCNIPDPKIALAEMKRVLRDDGKLVLVDHIRASSKPIYWLQKALESLSMRFEGESLTRRPVEHVAALGFTIIDRSRFGPGGIVERVSARKK